ncbi:MAG: hypothetical protein AAGU05_10670, partial [Anaerolineaceae bacterium]
MTWIPLLLADSSPCLRLRVLRELLWKPEDDPEVRELAALQQDEPLVRELAALQDADGSWDPARRPGNFPGGRVQAAAAILTQLATLGLDHRSPLADKAARYLFSQQRPDGSWPMPSVYPTDEGEEISRMPMQTA